MPLMKYSVLFTPLYCLQSLFCIMLKNLVRNSMDWILLIERLNFIDTIVEFIEFIRILLKDFYISIEKKLLKFHDEKLLLDKLFIFKCISNKNCMDPNTNSILPPKLFTFQKWKCLKWPFSCFVLQNLLFLIGFWFP